MTISELYSNLTTIHVNGRHIYTKLLFGNILEATAVRPAWARAVFERSGLTRIDLKYDDLANGTFVYNQSVNHVIVNK